MSICYGKQFSNGYRLLLQNNRLQSRLDKLKEIVKGKSVLHVGCCDHVPLIESKIRTRTWLHGILEEICEDVLGIDINDEAVRYVNSNGFSKRPVLCADITASDFCGKIPLDKCFDYVLLGEIVEHVDNPVAFLSAMDANVKKAKICSHNNGGGYVITVPNALCMMKSKLIRRGIEGINSDHRYWFTPYTIAKVMAEAGIKPEELFFVNYGITRLDKFRKNKSYLGDQIIILGT